MTLQLHRRPLFKYRVVGKPLGAHRVTARVTQAPGVSLPLEKARSVSEEFCRLNRLNVMIGTWFLYLSISTLAKF